MVRFPGFGGGINLRDQPNQVDPTQAIDLLNVVFTERGALKGRDGYAKFTSSAGTNRYDSLTAYYTTAATTQLVAGAGNRLEGISTAGAVVASTTLPTASPHFFARYGDPANQLIYAANGTDQLRTWNGAAFATPAWTGTAPTGKFVAVTSWDNRLVNARRAGTTLGDNPSTVRFSDPGVPNTWQANNFVDLTPGDGEQIQAMVSWFSYLFVFKESKFFVLNGTGGSTAGTPVWQFRGVDNKAGLVSPRAIAVGRDGVYFLTRTGVYKTTGSNPELVSPLLDPLFYGVTPDFYTGGVLNQTQITQAAMTFHREQIYLAFPSGASTTNNRLLVLDPRFGWWTLYDIPAAAMTPFTVTSQPDLIFAYAAGTNDLGRHGIGQVTDAGATINAYWKSGWWDMGIQSRKTVRESLLWGRGKLRMGIRSNFGAVANTQNIDFGAADTWGDGTNAADKWSDGTNPNDKWAAAAALAPRYNRMAARGGVFSMQISNYDATAWALYRMTHSLRSSTGSRQF
jgi:hypothetical protein